MRRIPYYVIPCLALLFLVIIPSAAQTEATDIFAPFVSRLNVKADTTRVFLSWKNSEDLSGFKRIYRASSEITDATFANAFLIARVAPEVESYIDTPPAGKSVFYAVILEDKNGEPYNVFIPYRNKTISGVRLEEKSAERDTAAIVTGLDASVANGTVTLQFTTSNPGRELMLYRSTSPITGYQDLTKALYSIILPSGTVRTTDVPLAGVDYYYAVVDAALLNAGKAVFTPGENATARSIQIPLAEGIARTEPIPPRIYPLPAPHILYALDTGKELLPPLPFLLPPTMRLQPSLEEKVDKVVTRIRHHEAELKFELLPFDEGPNLEGEDAALQTIAVAAGTGDYKASAESLISFLSTRHSPATEARARFYLGQAYCLRGQYREALKEFVFANNALYVETQPWIDVCLEKLYTKNK